jgi:hypothetical protein
MVFPFLVALLNNIITDNVITDNIIADNIIAIADNIISGFLPTQKTDVSCMI